MKIRHSHKTHRKLLWIAVSLILGGTVVLTLALARYTHVLILLWVLSIACFLMGAGEAPRFRMRMPKIGVFQILLIGIIALPLVVRLVHYTPTRMHGDDLLTAYFSLNYHPKTTNFFSGIPDKDIWVSSFPTVYFLFQKVFLTMFGTTLTTVKLSILPYVFGVSLLLFGITSTLTNTPAAVAAVWIYAFFACSIYLETLGLHFISSTASFLLFFYSLLHAFKNKSTRLFALSGVAAAGSYLSYTSSYIAFPILIVATIVWSVRFRTSLYLRLFLWACVGFLLTIAPFATYAATTRDYFLERIHQVSLINGDWSPHQGLTVSQSIFVIWDNFILSVRSLVESGIGGHGGYTFAREPFFTREAWILFSIGSICAVLWGFGSPVWWLILLILLVSFVSGMVLTLPPPAFHRLSLTFPFVAIVSALPIYVITSVKRVSKFAVLLVLLYLGLYAVTSLQSARIAIDSEQMIDDAAVILHVNRTYPYRSVHIAAFPSFALEKQWFFFPGTTARTIDTKFHKDYLTKFNTDERYVYVVALPDDFEQEFKQADPNGTFIRYSPKYGLFINGLRSKNP